MAMETTTPVVRAFDFMVQAGGGFSNPPNKRANKLLETALTRWRTKSIILREQLSVLGTSKQRARFYSVEIEAVLKNVKWQ